MQFSQAASVFDNMSLGSMLNATLTNFRSMLLQPPDSIEHPIRHRHVHCVSSSHTASFLVGVYIICVIHMMYIMYVSVLPLLLLIFLVSLLLL